RTGRVAEGERGRFGLSTAPPAGQDRCAALPPLGTQLAQLLLVGFPGTRAGPVSRGLVERGVGGLLLFRRNVVSAGQVRALVADLKRRAEIPLEVAVDQEPGTRVARLRGIVRASPSARELGRMPAGRVERYGRATGRDLAALGITADLAPVLDITGARWDGVIGDRSFGSDPATAGRAAVAFLRGLAAGGVAPVGKHFPGHGATTVDSHQRLPVVPASMARLHAHDLAPFREAIRSGLDAVMVGHLVVRAVDPGAPATLSPAVVDGLLRQRMGYGGLVVSDALEMGAIATTVTIPVAAERAVKAGVDQLVVSGHGAVPAVLAHLERAVAAGRLSKARVREAFLRVQAFKRVDRWAGC
ncbi:MAG TPA: glycoside hydrolase family 3 N-terminal domain-containing protein, partial [Actinomycetota bacterium]|nr:glycoside hydrolase family 3 N-terminal domain-containing protein [Actinomycetota bacterium]